MRVLDAYSCAGGAGMGYHQAGFQVVGVDIAPQPNYPFEHHVADAVEFIWKHGTEFDFIHASPPCQKFSTITEDYGKHPDLIGPTREVLVATGVPLVIENVMGAPIRKDLWLCGEMFGIRVIRHRKFELSDPALVPQPAHLKHRGRATGSGRSYRGDYNIPGYYASVYGTGGGKGSVQEWQDAMGIHWTDSKRELAEAIPPAYTKYIGTHVGLRL